MIVTVDFPDERTGANHLHTRFADIHQANRWIDYMKQMFGDLSYKFETIREVCDECRQPFTRGKP